MKKHLLMVLVLFLSLQTAQVFAQKTVSGRVVDDTGNPVPGVSVLEKGTSNGTATDVYGNFSLEVAPDATLVFQSIGLGTQEVAVGNQTSFNITMSENTKELGEVVVIGYGTLDKRDVSGSVSKVTGEEINSLPVASFESALQGRTAGVQINAGSGKAGQAFTIQVRGGSSVTASSQPLYVIDGIIVSSQATNQFQDEPLNPLADLNPNDIESIEILKDASASAIYGSRAANGVVIITTKRGKEGVTNIDFGYSYGVSDPTRKRGFLNRAEYLELFREAFENSATAKSFYNTFEEVLDDNIAGWRDGNYDQNWEDLAFQQGVFQQMELSANGGTEKTKFYTALNYTDQEGILINNRFRRLSGRLNLDHKVNDKLSFGLSFSLSQSINNGVEGDNGFANPMQLVALPPLQPVITNAGEVNDNTLYYNSYIERTNATRETTSLRNFTSLYATYSIIPELSFRTEIGIDLLNSTEDFWFGSKTVGNTGAPNGRAQFATSRILNYSWTNTLAYNKVFGDIHDFQALVGISFQESETVQSSVTGEIFPSDSFRRIASASSITQGSSAGTGFSFASYFARVNYKLMDKYLLGLSARIDGSSRFGENSRYGFFPAVSAGWIISEEGFMDGLGVVSFLKLRTSYGLTGNAEIGNFDALSLFQGNAYGTTSGARPVSVSSPDLKWETTAQFDIGIDFGFFDDRISGTFDYYVKNTSDLLLAIQVPSTSGFTTQTRNLGKMQNKGVEFSLNTRNLVGEFKWTTNFNISRNINKVTDLNGQVIAPGGTRYLNQARENNPLGVFFGAKYLGVDPANGDALFLGQDGKPTNNYNNAARVVLGDPNPDFFGGITNNFSYKGIDLSIFFQFVSGNLIYNGGGGFMSANGDFFDNQTKDQMKRWRKPGDNTQVPQARLFEGNGIQASSRYLEDGSYLRLKTITLGYTLPQTVLSRVKLRSVRFYITGQNLLTFTKYSGWDPEVSTAYLGTTSQNSNILLGNDFYTPPQARTFIFGVRIGL